MMKKNIYKSPDIKEVNIPLKRSICQQISGLGSFDANQDQLDNSDDFFNALLGL